jgi:hypothetical protein
VQIKPNQESYGQKQPEMTSQEQSEQTADFAPEPNAFQSLYKGVPRAHQFRRALQLHSSHAALELANVVNSHGSSRLNINP